MRDQRGSLPRSSTGLNTHGQSAARLSYAVTCPMSNASSVLNDAARLTGCGNIVAPCTYEAPWFWSSPYIHGTPRVSMDFFWMSPIILRQCSTVAARPPGVLSTEPVRYLPMIESKAASFTCHSPPPNRRAEPI